MINSPVYPIPPAYDARNKLDTQTIRKYVEYLIGGGAKYLMTTAGTSQFTHLDEEEITLLNETVVDAAQGTVKVIVGDINVPGANYVLLRYNTAADRFTSNTAFLDYFTREADDSLSPVLLHWAPCRTGGPTNYQCPPKNLLEELKSHPNIVGIKEECGTMDEAYEVSRLADMDFSVISAGGSMRRFCLTHPAGAQSYLAGIGSLWPRVEEHAYVALTEQPAKVYKEWLDGWENELFDVFLDTGWHQSLVFALDHLGLLRSCPRAPWPIMEELVQDRIKLLMSKFKGRI